MPLGTEKDWLVRVVLGLAWIGLYAGRGREVRKRQGKLGEGPSVDETLLGREGPRADKASGGGSMGAVC